MTAVGVGEDLGARMLAELERTLVTVEERAAAASVAFLASGSDVPAMQLAEAASDVVAAGRRMVAAQYRATTSTLRAAAQLRSVAPDAELILVEETPELKDLRIVWKSWFFFVRALCDHIYRLLLATEQGTTARRVGSMKAALNPRNPVAIMLAECLPGFMPWFERFREQRNAVKEGVNFGFTALRSASISVTFNVFRFDTQTGRRSLFVDSSDDRKMTLPDVLEAAQLLAQALALVAAPPRRASSGAEHE